MTEYIPLNDLLIEIRQCRICHEELPLGANPVLRANSAARLLVIGQAPGTKVHKTGIPWNDPSGERLRKWMDISREQFYDEEQVAIVPMGFCYPGRGKSGDLPPRKECAKQWHKKVLDQLPKLELILLIGQYAQNYYLPNSYKTLTETVEAWQQFKPLYLPLPHPSPRNNIWLRKNPWFEKEVVPSLAKSVKNILKGTFII